MIVGLDRKRYYGYGFEHKLGNFGFQVEVFKVTEAEAKLGGIAPSDFNDEILIAKK